MRLNYILKSLLFFFFFSISSAYSQIKLNISIIHKRGIDKGLILVSELHSVEIVDPKGVELKMKGGYHFRFRADFYQDKNEYGPSALVKINCDIMNNEDKLLKKFDEPALLASLGEEKVLVYRDETGQLIEISVTPVIL